MARFSDQDVAFMKRALALAARGRGRVEPNPMVGCVIVRNGQIIGEGYHHRFGGRHAEIDALAHCQDSSRRATCYVTLEPCCHHGKTGPCTEALIAASAGRVIAACRDPGEHVSGGGFERLRQAGIKVESGLLARESRQLNGAYWKRHYTGMPWVLLKWAQSLDGKIATRSGDSQWISGPKSRRWVHRIRANLDAIIVGINTAIHDNPLLTCRDARVKRRATRIVLDPHLRLPTQTHLAQTAGEFPLMVVTTRANLKVDHAARLRDLGAEVLAVGHRGGELDLSHLLETLGQRGMSNVMVEGGGTTLGRFHDRGLADELLIFVSPRVIGGKQAISPLEGVGPKSMSQVAEPVWIKRRQSGKDTTFQVGLTDANQWDATQE